MLLIVIPIVGAYNCSLFCCALLFVRSGFAIISIGKRELIALLCLSSWYFVIVVWLVLTMQRVCLQCVIVVFPDHTHVLFLVETMPFVIDKSKSRKRITVSEEFALFD